MSELFIVCSCEKYKLLDAQEVKKIVSALRSSGREVLIVADFCRMALATNDKPRIAGLVACHARAQLALCAYAQLECPQCYDLRAHSAQALAEQMQIPYDATAAPEDVELPSYDDSEVIAWYPTIDYKQCRGCMKCVDFCMFGVYDKDEKRRPRVNKPLNCKTNCPACARVCPHGAIIFPKHGDAPINGGEGGSHADLNLEKALNDKALYEKLSARRALARKINLFSDEDS